MQNPWEKMAGFYDGMSGQKGHDYHKKYAFPLLIDRFKKNDVKSVLDMGCGQGAFFEWVKPLNIAYSGVDLSKKMIENAKVRHGNNATFICANGININEMIEFSDKTFDAITFIFSLQDMPNFNDILREVTAKLSFNGKIYLFMLHPGFRIPRQSGWEEDEKTNKIYRRIDRYFSEGTVPLDTKILHDNKKITSYFYHRPLQKYLEIFSKNKLEITYLEEIEENNKDFAEIPNFMYIELKKS